MKESDPLVDGEKYRSPCQSYSFFETVYLEKPSVLRRQLFLINLHRILGYQKDGEHSKGTVSVLLVSERFYDWNFELDYGNRRPNPLLRCSMLLNNQDKWKKQFVRESGCRFG